MRQYDPDVGQLQEHEAPNASAVEAAPAAAPKRSEPELSWAVDEDDTWGTWTAEPLPKRPREAPPPHTPHATPSTWKRSESTRQARAVETWGHVRRVSSTT